MEIILSKGIKIVLLQAILFNFCKFGANKRDWKHFVERIQELCNN